jgi:hypothetical protein
MQITYAVTWQEPAGDRHSGRLELGDEALQFEGRNGTGATKRSIRYADVERYRLAHSSGERLQGRPTLIVELVDESAVKIASVAQPGIIGEVAERLAGLAQREVERAALVVPLRPGAKEAAAKLLATGPPFDPHALGLESHDVYLTDDEAVFVFEGVASEFVERLAADETVWDAADAWRPLIDGRIRYADPAYAWPG